MVLVKRRRVHVSSAVLSRYVCPLGQGDEQSPAGLFGNARPLEVEVGFGKGLFLIAAASAHPRTNYLGIEVSMKCLQLTAQRLDRAGVRNVRLLLADARYVLAEFLGPASVQAVHAYFPDPWWKRRHRKRRLFGEAFVRDVARVLEPGGEMHVWTDVQEYFQSIEALVGQCAALRRLEAPPAQHPAHEMDYRTHFERKMRRAGREIYRIRCCKPLQ